MKNFCIVFLLSLICILSSCSAEHENVSSEALLKNASDAASLPNISSSISQTAYKRPIVNSESDTSSNTVSSYASSFASSRNSNVVSDTNKKSIILKRDTSSAHRSNSSLKRRQNTSSSVSSKLNISSSSSSKPVSTHTETSSKIDNNEENDMINIEIKIGNKAFSAKLYSNSASKALAENMPMTIQMEELNGNEKFYYMDKNLPADSINPNKINAGDLMLYQSDCLVLFYKTFRTSYKYTPLGYIENADDLAACLGNGNVTVTFNKK